MDDVGDTKSHFVSGKIDRLHVAVALFVLFFIKQTEKQCVIWLQCIVQFIRYEFQQCDNNINIYK